MKVPHFFFPYTSPGPRPDDWQPPFWLFVQEHAALWMMLFLLSGILLTVLSIRCCEDPSAIKKGLLLAAACIFLFAGVMLAALAADALHLFVS